MMNKSTRGYVSQGRGAMFEQLIERCCINYRRKGIADIQKTPEPMRVIKPINRQKGLFQAVFEKKAQPDFKGVLKGGQAVIFEAKHTDAASIERKRISDEQRDNFVSHAELGAECFVLVSFKAKRFYKVPWSDWENMKGVFGKVSVTEKDLVEYEIQIKGGLLDFL